MASIDRSDESDDDDRKFNSTKARDRKAIFGALYFVFAFVALIHPVYTLVGNRVAPRVLGLPFSLVYVLAWVAANTLVLVWLYRSRVIDASEGEAAHRASPGEGADV